MCLLVPCEDFNVLVLRHNLSSLPVTKNGINESKKGYSKQINQ